MALYGYTYERSARKHFRWWYNWAVRSRLQPMIEVAGMMKRRFENIITYLRHRITNAGSESINAKIQWVKYTARGFRNKQNFIHAIYFHCGGLDLAPRPTKNPEAPYFQERRDGCTSRPTQFGREGSESRCFS